MVKLKEIVSVQIGFPFRSRLERDENGNVCVVQMKDIGEDGLFGAGDLVRIQMSEVKERYLVGPQDIVMRTRGQITTAAEVNQDLGVAVVSGPLFRIRVESDKVLPSYLTWYINQPAAQAYLASRAKGTSVQMISKRAVEEMEIPLPSLEEQHKIVELAALAAKEQELLRQLGAKRKQFVEIILLQFAKGQTEKGEG